MREQTNARMTAIETFVQYLITGLLIGGVYALMSVGLALIFGIMKVVNFAQGEFMIFGPTPRGIVTPLATEAFRLGPFFLNQARTYAFGLALIVAFVVYLFLQYTDLGKALRAAADEPEAALYMGISVSYMHRVAFGLGIALAAVARWSVGRVLAD